MCDIVNFDVDFELLLVKQVFFGDSEKVESTKGSTFATVEWLGVGFDWVQLRLGRRL
jgi:hypothetical protein